MKRKRREAIKQKERMSGLFVGEVLLTQWAVYLSALEF